MYLPIAVKAQPQITAAIAHVMKEMTPAVQRINYEVAQDWAGDWAIFFNVLLSDEASERDRLREVAPRILRLISHDLDIPSHGMLPHIHFRSQSEQAELNDPAWA